jgi:hypothetical protein
MANLMIYVVFEDGADERLALGPYRVAEIADGQLFVFDRLHPFVLATVENGRWLVNDGLDSPGYHSVRFLSEP